MLGNETGAGVLNLLHWVWGCRAKGWGISSVVMSRALYSVARYRGGEIYREEVANYSEDQSAANWCTAETIGRVL